MTVFELFGVLIGVIAVFGYINHRFIGLPDTIGITAMGLISTMILAVLGAQTPAVVTQAKLFAEQLNFSELVFHGLLGVLLFAGSLHVNVSDLNRHKAPILALSTLGVVISTTVVGFLTHWVSTWMGAPIELAYCLLFGALISPTDPIAVMGVLKTASIGKSLEMKISGESLFNDGTAVVAFLVMLGIATGATSPTAAGLATMLAKEVLGALVLGLVVGYAAFFLIKGVDSYPVEILITVALATGGYALAERVHVSAPLAVVVMGLVIGNHGARSVMSEKTREHLFSFWELLDEVFTLLLFGLIGVKLIALADDPFSWALAFMFVPVVLVARFVSVALPLGTLRLFATVSPHAIKVLTWGGLRGGISIALALSLPEFAGKPQIVAGTYAVVLFSLLVQATTLGRLLRCLKKRMPADVRD